MLQKMIPGAWKSIVGFGLARLGLFLSCGTLIVSLCLPAPAAHSAAESSEKPPVISIPSINSGEVSIENVLIRGEITHPLGVQGYRIYNNDVLLYSRAVYAQSPLVLLHTITLREGTNKIEIIPIDHDGNLSGTRKVLNLRYHPPKPTLWVIAVGISRYAAINSDGCRFCVNDAEAFADRMQAWAPDKLKRYRLRVFRLLNEKAGYSDIRDHLLEIMRQVSAGDRILFYFSGLSATIVQARGLAGIAHYLLPYDARPNVKELPFSAIGVRELANSLAAEQVKTYILLDTSFSFNEEKRFGKSLYIDQKLTQQDRNNIRDNLAANRWIEELVSGGDIQVLASSRGQDPALENPKYEHGLFTHFLLDLFEGNGDVNKDGRTTLDEAFAYVYKKVRDETDGQQSPIVMSTARKSPVISPGTTPKTPPPSVQIRLENTEASVEPHLLGTVTADSGIESVEVTVNGATVASRTLSGPTVYELDEAVFLEPYGNRITVIATDRQGSQATDSVFTENPPAAPHTPVLIESFYPDTRSTASSSSAGNLPQASALIGARHDVQKILADFELLYRDDRVKADLYRSVRSFWAVILDQLDAYRDAESDDRRKDIWREMHKKLATWLPGVQIQNFEYLQNLWTPEDSIPINVEVRKGQVPEDVVHYRLTVNRAPVLERELTGGASAVRNFRQEVFLKEGTNQCAVTVQNSLGLAVNRSFFVLRQPVRDVSAIVVGVSRYSGLPAHGFARNNAADVRDTLIQMTTILPERIRLLTEAEATKEGIERTTASGFAQDGAEAGSSPLIVYFSGMGFFDENRDLYLLPHDADLRNLRGTGIEVKQWIESIEKNLNPSDALLIMDLSLLPVAESSDRQVKRILSLVLGNEPLRGSADQKGSQESRLCDSIHSVPQNWALLLAVSDEKSEPVGTDAKNSFFTHHLLWQLRDLNQDGSADELDLLRSSSINLLKLFARVKESAGQTGTNHQCFQLIANLRRPFTFQFLPAQTYLKQAYSLLEEDWTRKGTADFGSERSVRFRQMLEKALAIGTRSGEAHMWLGYLDISERNFPAADSHFERAIEQAESEGKQAEYYGIWGVSYLEQGDYEKGRRLLEKALALNQDKSLLFWLRINYADALSVTGRFDEAREYLLKTNDLLKSSKPDIGSYADTWQALLFIEYADVFFLQGDTENALEVYRTLQGWKIEKETVSYKMAWISFARGEYESALLHIQDSFPENEYLKLLTYFCFSFIDRPKEAQDVLAALHHPDRDVWFQDIVSFLKKDTDRQGLLENAGDNPVYQCEAYFFIALSALVENDRETAQRFLELAVGTRMLHASEWAAAQVMANDFSPARAQK